MKRKKIGRWVLGILLACALFLLLAGKDGLVNLYFNIHRPIIQQQADIQSLNAEIDSLERENEKLETDTAHIEKIAREKLGMAKEGEKIYKFTEGESQ